MDIKDFISGVLTKTLNLTGDELAELIYTKAADSEDIVLKDDALDLVLDKDGDRIENIKKNTKPSVDVLKAEYSKARKETMQEFEANLKKDFGIESDKEGIELVNVIVSKQKPNTKLTDEDVKKHPLYLSLEENRVPKEKYDELEGEFTEYKKSHERSSLMGTVHKNAIAILNEMNPIVSENPRVAQTRQEDFLNKFDSYNFELRDDGNHLILDKEGNRIEDKHGNPLKFKAFVEEVATANYDFAKQQNRQNSGNQQQQQQQNQNGDIKIPSNEQEYVKFMAEETDPAVRAKITAGWDEAKKSE